MIRFFKWIINILKAIQIYGVFQTIKIIVLYLAKKYNIRSKFYKS